MTSDELKAWAEEWKGDGGFGTATISAAVLDLIRERDALAAELEREKRANDDKARLIATLTARFGR